MDHPSVRLAGNLFWAGAICIAVLVISGCRSLPDDAAPGRIANLQTAARLAPPTPSMTEEGCQETPGCWQEGSSVGHLDDGDVTYALNESSLPDSHFGADGIWLGLTNDDCYVWRGVSNGIDQDEDGLIDYCELQLAKAFAPVLSFASGESCSGGEGYWVAKVIDNYFTGTGDLVKLGYLMAYYDDCGAGGHLGDSEFVQLTVEYNPATQHWVLVDSWLSEHACDVVTLECIAGSFFTHTSEWGAGFDFPAGRRGSFPRVYISKNKHANYHSAPDCDAGGAVWSDTCSGHSDVGRFKVWQDHNLGSAHHHLLDCAQSQSGNSLYTGTECFWSGEQFGGWHGGKPGTRAAPYSSYLLSVAFQATFVTVDEWWVGSYGY